MAAKALVLSLRSVWSHGNHGECTCKWCNSHYYIRFVLNGRLFDSSCRPGIYLPRKMKVQSGLSLVNRIMHDCCTTCMCIHMITVTSDGPLTQHQGLRGHIPFIPCLLVGTIQEFEQIKKISSYTVNRVLLTRNRWWAPFVARNKMSCNQCNFICKRVFHYKL